jgi:hypothetical protein
MAVWLHVELLRDPLVEHGVSPGEDDLPKERPKWSTRVAKLCAEITQDLLASGEALRVRYRHGWSPLFAFPRKLDNVDSIHASLALGGWTMALTMSSVTCRR